MKGTLQKKKDQWVVIYGSSPSGRERWPIELPLHPDNVAVIKEQSMIFDNSESRIKAYSTVEFDIVDVCEKHGDKDCPCKSGFISYAKLK